MRSDRLLGLVLVLSGIVILTLFAARPACAERPYSIGLIFPLSGDAASLGSYVKNGVDLAYTDLDPELRKSIKLIYEDDQLKSAQSVSAFRKLTSDGNLDAVFVFGSGVGSAVGPIAEKQGKLLIAIGASDKKFVANSTYLFTHWVSPDTEGQKLAEEVKRRGLKRLAMFYQQQEGILASQVAFNDALKKQGMADAIVVDQAFTPETTDFRAALAKARSLKVDGVCVFMFAGGLVPFSKQFRESGIKAEFFGAESFEDEYVIKASEGALYDTWYVNSDSAQDDFVKRYQARYGAYPGVGAANAYDALKLVALALKLEGHDNKRMADYLRRVQDYRGATGTYSATGDNRFGLPAAVKIVTREGFEKLG